MTKLCKRLIINSLCAISLFCSSQVSAFDIGPKVSTLGFGVEASFLDFGLLKLRANANMLNLSKDINTSNINYNAKLKLRSAGLYGDVHLFHGSFMLTAGLLANGNKVMLSASPTSAVTLNGTTYQVAQLGTVNSELKFRKISPYVGVGYDLLQTACTVSLEAGILFQGKPKVDVTATGTLANDQQMLSRLQNDIADKANKILVRYYPMLSLAIRI